MCLCTSACPSPRLPFFIGEFPTIDPRSCSFAERAAILRDVIQGHIDGRRISSNTNQAVAIVKSRGTRMGGLAHDKGPEARHKSMQKEARRIKPVIADCIKKHGPCKIHDINKYLQKMKVKNDKGEDLSDKVIWLRMQYLKMKTS